MKGPCHTCGSSSPDSAFFCVHCGAVLAEPQPATSIRPIRVSRRAPAPEPPPLVPVIITRRRCPARRPFAGEWRLSDRRVYVPLVGFCYALIFLVGMKLYLDVGGLPGFGVWPIGLLAGGALLAEQAWVNGRLWDGLRGMVLWSGTTWLFAAGRIVPWVPLLVVAWLLTQSRWYRRAGGRGDQGQVVGVQGNTSAAPQSGSSA